MRRLRGLEDVSCESRIVLQGAKTELREDSLLISVAGV